MQFTIALITLFGLATPGLASQLAVETQRPEPRRTCTAKPAPQPRAQSPHAAAAVGPIPSTCLNAWFDLVTIQPEQRTPLIIHSRFSLIASDQSYRSW